MKNYLVLVAIATFVIFSTSCDSRDEITEEQNLEKQKNEESFVPKDNKVGQMHNEGLANIFANLRITPNTDKGKLKASPADLLQQAIEITNENIRVQAGEIAYLQAQEVITKDVYLQITPEIIQARMTDTETLVLEETINAVSIQNGAKPVSQIKIRDSCK